MELGLDNWLNMEKRKFKEKSGQIIQLVAFMFGNMLVPIHCRENTAEWAVLDLWSLSCCRWTHPRGNAQLSYGYIQIWSSGKSQLHPTVNFFGSFAFLVRASSLGNEVSFFSYLFVLWKIRKFIDGTCYIWWHSFHLTVKDIEFLKVRRGGARK